MEDPSRLMTIQIEGNCPCLCLKLEHIEVRRTVKFFQIFRQYAKDHVFLRRHLKFYWNEMQLKPGDSPASVGMPNMSTIKVFHDTDLTFGDVELAVLINKGATGRAEISSATSETGTDYVNL